MQVIIYARKSPTVSQWSIGLSRGEQLEAQRIMYAAACETQFKACRDWCAKQGHQIIGEFSDPGMSGGDANRPGLWEAIDAIPKGGAIVVMKLDRLVRDKTAMVLIDIEIKKKKGVILSTMDEHIEDDPAGRMMQTIISAIDQFQREMNAARISVMMRQHIKAGRVMSSNPPYGFMVDHNGPLNRYGRPGRLMINPLEQDAIAEIKVMHGLGYSACQIASKLNKSRHEPRGLKWNSISISRIIRREG